MIEKKDYFTLDINGRVCDSSGDSNQHGGRKPWN